MNRPWVLGAGIVLLYPTMARPQEWNSEVAVALVGRAIERRVAAQSDSGLLDYQCRAHGFVFFLGQLGDLSEPPRLVKSDQLELEVYWKAPGIAKQRIIGWRDRADLPTDIRYHRDHLGIVTNNFGDRIAIGQGEEVRSVPHPLSRDAPALYDYALVDSSTIRLPTQSVRVSVVRVRPKDFNAALVVGSLYIDVEQAELVQFRFNFTRNAYVDETLEDITIVLENGLWDGLYWLPRRQEIEIRRRASWLDLPARGIIRGWWEIDGYRFNTGVLDSTFRGQEIVAAPQAVRDTFQWDRPLDASIRAVAGPGMTFDLDDVRAEVKRLARDHVLSGLAPVKPGAAAASDLLHFNRVEGLAPGIGAILRPGGGAVEVRAWASYGVSDRRLKGGLAARRRLGRFTVSVDGGRAVRDIGDERVISPVLNSLLAQEVARDYGDYYLATGARASLSYDLGPRTAVSLTVGTEETADMGVVAQPASGTFRANPRLGAGTMHVGVLRVDHRNAGLTFGRGVGGAFALEAGTGANHRYLRVHARGRAQIPAGSTDLVARGWLGWGSEDLPRHAAFVLGGRGTLVGEQFRAWGGRWGGLGTVEWRIPAPFPSVPLGAYVSTGDRISVAPFVGAGWLCGQIEGGVGKPTDGVRAVLGLGLEWFHSLFRIDVAVSLRDRRAGVVVDVRRDLWPIL